MKYEKLFEKGKIGKLTLKNMKTGEQKLVSIDELIREVK